MDKNYSGKNITVTTEQEFIHFLKQNNTYEKFILQSTKCGLKKIDIKAANPLVILTFFPLEEEETYYWKKLSNEWTVYINKKFFIPLFIQFLQDNNIYEEYYNNVNVTSFNFKKYLTMNENIEQALLELSPYAFLLSCYFNTNNRLWHDMASKWLNYYYEKI